MKKTLLVVFILVLLIGGVLIYIKLTPPLLTGSIVKSDDQQTVVIGLGNKGFSDLKVEDVKVNNNTSPTDIKMQVSNAKTGFVISNEEQNIQLKNVKEVKIDKGTIPEEVWAKQDEGTVTEADTIYGLTVSHNEEIHNVHIIYRYLGVQFIKTISLD